jgi:hypothetical protein
MIRLAYVLIILLLVSPVYAAETIDTPADSSSVQAPTEVASLAPPAILNEGNAASLAYLKEPKTTSFSNSYVASKNFKRPDYSYRALQFAFLGSMAADLGTTWSLPKGMVEGNPLLGRSKAQQISVSGAIAAFTLLESRYLHKKGNTKTAKYVLWMGSIAHIFAASYNASH